MEKVKPDMLSLAKPEQLSPIPPNVLALATAAENGDVKNLKQLLTVSGVEINAVCNDIEETALHIACHGNQFESVDALLALGADPDRINIYGHTALHYACFEGSADIVKRLLTKDVNVNVNAQTKKRSSYIQLRERELREERRRLFSSLSSFLSLEERRERRREEERRKKRERDKRERERDKRGVERVQKRVLREIVEFICYRHYCSPYFMLFGRLQDCSAIAVSTRHQGGH